MSSPMEEMAVFQLADAIAAKDATPKDPTTTP